MSQVQLDAVSEGPKIPLLTARSLRVHFLRQEGILRKRDVTIKAVDDVSFDIMPSSIFTIVGESGSGKTTIARCIMGLEKPTSGTLTYKGNEIHKLSGRAFWSYRRDVQMIFQDPFGSLNPRQDVFSAISTPIRALTEERDQTEISKKVSKLLSEVGLEESEVLHKLPHQLSGGQRQRVNIARALATDPKILVADEPVTMLDASQRLNILSIIMQLKTKRNLSVLLITHDLASAKVMGGSLGVMYLGKLVEVGQTQDVLSKPHHPYTELILASTPKLSIDSNLGNENVASLESSYDVKKGCTFAPRCRYATSICGEVEPELLEKTPAHNAACHNAINLSK